MKSTSPLEKLRENVDFDGEEKGTFIVLILLFVFIALTPKDGCSFHASAPADAPAAEAAP